MLIYYWFGILLYIYVSFIMLEDSLCIIIVLKEMVFK